MDIVSPSYVLRSGLQDELFELGFRIIRSDPLLCLIDFVLQHPFFLLHNLKVKTEPGLG